MYLKDPENSVLPGVAIRVAERNTLGHYPVLVSMDPDSEYESAPGTDRTCEYQVEFVLDPISIKKVMQECDSFIETLGDAES